MNHWNETREILQHFHDAAALATVVRIQGSAYRRPGAKMLVRGSGATCGSVSGGCLEGDVREVALAVAASRRPRLRRYDTRSEPELLWGLDLGCEGVVEIFVQPIGERPTAEERAALGERLAGDEPFAIVSALDGTAAGALRVVDAARAVGSLGDEALDVAATARARQLLAGKPSRVERVGARELFFEILQPPPDLVVCGAGDDARPIVAYAADAGFRVTLADHREALLRPERFPRATRFVAARPEEADGAPLPRGETALAVVKMHSLSHDREWARRLLARGFGYVGLMGPRARGEAIRAAIGAADDGRVYGPVGLDLGADGAAQIALAVVAELLAHVARRSPGHLRDRSAAIHGD